MGRVLVDHDFHPDEPTVRIFRTPAPGVLRLDDGIAVTEAVYDRVVLRHYAFTGHWFKVNVTTDLTYFKLIVPCGLTGRAVTSVNQLLGDATPPIEVVKARLAEHMLDAFHV